jgi:DNA-binding MarR family transcriptional regulator
MELTGRQEAFIRNLVDLYLEHAEPIHYSRLAERLGVSPFTAYDMMRLLEERGYVRSEYQLQEGKRQSGRSIIVFAPTPKAHQVIAELTAEAPQGDWEHVTDALLERVRSGRFEDSDVVMDVLARMPQDDPPALRYCTEVATVLTLRVWRSGHWARLNKHIEPLLVSGDAVSREDLLLLGGLAIGVLAGSGVGDDAWLDEMAGHTRTYLGTVGGMADSDWRRLAMNLRAALDPLVAGKEAGT